VAEVDVYKGCKIDYRGPNVTGDNFLKVLKGDATAPGPVLKSTKNDRVFVYFTDHGGVGILGVPSGAAGGYIHAADLNAALENATYKELLFYLEACESGSIFEGLLKAPNAFAVTAANAHESSWGWYCPPQDFVNGTAIGSCLGDQFSINWLEDADVADFSNETIKKQVANVANETTKSHVQQYGNSSVIPAETIGHFEGKMKSYHRGSLKQDLQDYSKSAVRTRDIEIHLAYYRMLRAKTQQEEAVAGAELEELRRKQAAQDARFSQIALALEPNQQKAAELLVGSVERFSHGHLDCHKAALQTVVKNCGPLDDYTMRYSRLFANLCEIGMDQQTVQKAIEKGCGKVVVI
jgi:legumain